MATHGAKARKAAALLRLVRKRQSMRLDGYACIGDFHDGAYECDHVSPWTKAARSVDAEVMVVGQDWASADVLEGNGESNPVRAQLGYDPDSPTNKNLDQLLGEHFGLIRADCYLTNAFPFVKPGGKNANIPLRDMVQCAGEFTLEEVRIVAPRLVLCLGLQTFRALGRAAGMRRPRTMDEAVDSPFDFEGSMIHCVAHAGDLGTNNRGRDRVAADWRRVASSLRRPSSQGRPRRKTKGGVEVKVNEKELTKGQLRKLEALRKSLGQRIADDTFLRWLAQQVDGQAAGPAADPTAERIAAVLQPVLGELKFTRGTHYVLRRGRGRVIVEQAKG